MPGDKKRLLGYDESNQLILGVTDKMGFQTDYRLMQVESIAECWSILQYFRPILSYQLLLRSLFCIY